MSVDGLLYENGKIRITKNIFANGEGEQFVIATIKGLRDEHKGKPTGLLVMGLILIALAITIQPFPYSQYAMGGVGAFFLALYMFSKENWRLYLTGPQGEAEAFRTRDPEVFRDVSRTLKKAIAAHLG